MPLYKSLIFFILLLVSSSSILAFRYSFILFLQCLLASDLTMLRLSTELWFGSCNHSILACLIWSKKWKHSSSYLGLCCCNSYRHRFLLGEVLIFSLMFSQAVITSLLSRKFSKAANLFEILFWYYCLNSRSLSFLRLNFFASNTGPN